MDIPCQKMKPPVLGMGYMSNRVDGQWNPMGASKQFRPLTVLLIALHKLMVSHYC